MLSFQRLINGEGWKRHLIFVLAIVLVLLAGVFAFTAGGFRFERPGLVITNCLFFIAYIYLGRWLCGYFYLRERIGQFILCSVILAFSFLYAEFLTIRYLLNSPYVDFVELLYGATPFFTAALILGMLLKMMRATMERQLIEAQVKVKQKESEFTLLQAQVSPHFLFNALNNLYGISLEQQERVPKLLLELSKLLRYSVYGSRKTFVPLREELEYIHSYISFEKIRMSDRLVLNTEITKLKDSDILIAPLILIVFIENAFKHARVARNEKIFVNISFKLSGRFLCFEVSNSFQYSMKEDEFDEGDSGIGLSNTTKRLELLYRDDYELKQYTNNDLYFVELKLGIKHA